MISGYQIHSVIRAYMEHMKARVMSHKRGETEIREDQIEISEESIRLLLVGQIEKHVSNRIANSNRLQLASVDSEIIIK
jgi:hypothetical protein